MNRSIVSAIAPFAAAAIVLVAGAKTASAAERDQKFFQSIEGGWSGPGEIVAGKFKGTKFVCNFTGSAPAGDVAVNLDGACRVGVFLQRMSAKIKKSRSGYTGTFMDGAEGKGLDIVSGSVVDSRKVVFGLNRKALNGSMIARLDDNDGMVVTVSVRVEDQMIPVIGVNLKRVDATAVGSIAQQ
jgi:hypothetical protein